MISYFVEFSWRIKFVILKLVNKWVNIVDYIYIGITLAVFASSSTAALPFLSFFRLMKNQALNFILFVLFNNKWFTKFGRRPQRQCGLITMCWFSRIDYVYRTCCCFLLFLFLPWRCTPLLNFTRYNLYCALGTTYIVPFNMPYYSPIPIAELCNACLIYIINWILK